MFFVVFFFQVFSPSILIDGKESRTVSAEAKYDGQSWQEAKIGRLIFVIHELSNL